MKNIIAYYTVATVLFTAILLLDILQYCLQCINTHMFHFFPETWWLDNIFEKIFGTGPMCDLCTHFRSNVRLTYSYWLIQLYTAFFMVKLIIYKYFNSIFIIVYYLIIISIIPRRNRYIVFFIVYNIEVFIMSDMNDVWRTCAKQY